MSAAEDLLYYDDIMKGGATQHDMGRHGTTWGDILQKTSLHMRYELSKCHPMQLPPKILFQSLAQGQEFFQTGDNALLLGQRREGNKIVFQNFKRRDILYCGTLAIRACALLQNDIKEG